MADTPVTTGSTAPTGDNVVAQNGGIASVLTAIPTNPAPDLYAAAFDAANKIVFTPNADGSNSISILTPNAGGNSTAAVTAPLVPNGVPTIPKKDNTTLYIAIAILASFLFIKKGRA